MDTNSADHKKRTVMSYDALAGELAEGFDQYFEDYGRLDADFFLSRMNEGATILDVGCGVGTASRYKKQKQGK
jgi:2-polyprenyl-3-methyl-5-hydroxy-6-metoxy-1,4-benzoquinol methylase